MCVCLCDQQNPRLSTGKDPPPYLQEGDPQEHSRLAKLRKQGGFTQFHLLLRCLSKVQNTCPRFVAALVLLLQFAQLLAQNEYQIQEISLRQKTPLDMCMIAMKSLEDMWLKTD